jgi:hypothetical protein
MSRADSAGAVGSEPNGAGPACRLDEIAAAVAALRCRLGSGDTVDLGPLRQALAVALHSLPDGTVTAPDRAGALLSLLDELTLLGRLAEAERHEIGRRLLELTRHRRADAAYAAQGRQP